jgi:hypothetical protein
MTADLGIQPAPLPRTGQKRRFEASLSREVRGREINIKASTNSFFESARVPDPSKYVKSSYSTFHLNSP